MEPHNRPMLRVFPALEFRSLRRLECYVIFIVLLQCFAESVSAAEFGISRRSQQYASYNRPAQPVTPSYSTSPALPPTAPAPAYSAEPASKVASQAVVSQYETETTAGQRPLSNVVRLVVFEQTGQSFGSGAYIGNYGEYGLILSNWHVVCESDGLVHVHFSNGFSSYGAVMTADKKWDLALVAISRPPQSVPLLPVARTLPKPGDALWIAGYGSGVYRLAGGRCVRYLAPEIPKDGTTPLYEIIELSVSARQGDSGGPILNADGELAGVLFGSDMIRNTAGSGCERVNRFLSQAHSTLGLLTPRPEDYFFSIERGKPRRMLHESRNSAPAVQPNAESSVRRGADFAGSAGAFGIRSGSRHYLRHSQPVSTERPSSDPRTSSQQPAEFEKPSSDPALRPSGNETKRAVEPGIRTAVWRNAPNDAANLHGEKTPAIPQSPIVQTGHQVSDTLPNPFSDHLVALNPINVRATADSFEKAEIAEPYTEEPPEVSTGLAAVSERNASLHPLISIGGTLLTLVLLSLSIQLLKSDGTRPRFSGRSAPESESY